MHRDRVVGFLDDLLDAGSIPDYGPQGLQIEGKDDVRKVAVGVSASVELFRRAVEAGADMILCHHGMFWDSESRVVKGRLKQRLRLLIEHEISLVGYHLVLDAHDEHGNNAVIARELGLVDVEPFGEYRGTLIGRKGRFDPPLPLRDLESRVREVFGGEPLIYGFGPEPVRTIGVISGGAVDQFLGAIEQKLDAYLTGEVKEFVQEVAREERVTYVSAGHYRTETFGVRALAERLERELGIETVFIDVPNRV